MKRKPQRRRFGGEKVKEKSIDELLELIWTLRERGEVKLEEVLKQTEEDGAENALRQMEEANLIEVKDSSVLLREAGDKRAREITRRHRLAERLLLDVFELEEKEVESAACEFEHILSPEVTESICTLLGHPPTCPHGKPIPSGNCCTRLRKELKPLVRPLEELDLGERGRIVFIAPKYHTRLDRLVSLGIVPGHIIKLHQRQPSFVVEIDETTVALDPEIANEIFVKKV